MSLLLELNAAEGIIALREFLLLRYFWANEKKQGKNFVGLKTFPIFASKKINMTGRRKSFLCNRLIMRAIGGVNLS